MIVLYLIGLVPSLVTLDDMADGCYLPRKYVLPLMVLWPAFFVMFAALAVYVLLTGKHRPIRK